MSQPIYHITPRALWDAAQSAGEFRAVSLSEEGFIHFSTAAQVVRVANSFYRQHTDLIVLVVDPDRLRANLVWEAPSHPLPGGDAPPDDHFPHLYGALNLDAVLRVAALTRDESGAYTGVTG